MGRRRAEDAAIALLRTATSRRILLNHDCRSTWSRIGAASRRHVVQRDDEKAAAATIEGRRGYAATAAQNANVAVLGGGLTGLTTAYYLAKQLPPSAKITLYEQSNRLGGWIWTDKVQVDVGGKKGTVSFERGPRSLTSLSGNTWRYDDLVMYDLAIDLGLNLVSVPNRPRYIYYPDHLAPLPPAIGFFDILREPLFTESLFAGFGLLFKAFRTKPLPEKDQSVADWIYEISLSRAAADNLASAIVHGIYGGDIYKLSARSVLDRIYWGWYIPNPGRGLRPMPLLEQEILETLGQDKYIQKLALEPKGALLHFGSGGLQTLTDALSDALTEQPNVTIKMNTSIEKVTYNEAGQTVGVSSKTPTASSSTYDKVISTLSGQDTARLAGGELPSLEDAHSVSIMTVNLWYPRENLKPPGFGYLIPRSVPEENNPEHALGVFFDSDVETKSPDEPAGTKLFVLMGGHYYDDKTPPTEEEAIQQAKAVLERHLRIPRDTPCHAVARFARECIPQHYVGHHERMAAADMELQAGFGGRLAVAGGSYSRIGLMASLRAGYDIATHTSKRGLDGTGLEYTESVGNVVWMPLADNPVRRLK